MTRLLKVVAVTGACAGAGMLTLSQVDLGGEANTTVAKRDPSVRLAVAPPREIPATTPAVNVAPSFPKTPPLPQRVPRVPNFDMAVKVRDAKPGSLGEAAKTRLAATPSVVRAGPSKTASMLYGFPAGRPVRVIAHEGDFVAVQDVRSGAGGWIDAAALEPNMLADSNTAKSKTAKSEPEPEPKPATRVRRADAEIKAPKPVEPIPQERERGLLDGQRPGGREGADFAGFVERGFGG